MRPSSFRLDLSLVAAASITFLGACNSTPPDFTLAPTDTNIAGTYDLSAVNGAPLPSTSQINVTQALSVTAERLVIAPGNTWADTSTTVLIDLTTGSQSNPTLSASAGTLSVSNTIQFVATVGGTQTFSGSVNANVLTVLFHGSTFTYLRNASPAGS